MGAFLKYCSLHSSAHCETLNHRRQDEKLCGYLMNPVDDVIVQQLLFVVV